jgi:hypothetical protein
MPQSRSRIQGREAGTWTKAQLLLCVQVYGKRLGVSEDEEVKMIQQTQVDMCGHTAAVAEQECPPM